MFSTQCSLYITISAMALSASMSPSLAAAQAKGGINASRTASNS